MANPAFRQSVSATEITGTGSYAASAFGSATIPGDLIVLTAVDDSTSTNGTTSGVSDNYGNTYQKITFKESGTTGVTNVSMWYAYDIKGGAGHVITVSYNGAASNNNSFVAQEFTGFGSANPFDKFQKGSGTSTAVSSGATIALSQNNQLIVVGMGCDTVQVPTAGAGYSNLAQNGSGATTPTQAAQESKIQAGNAAVTGTFTITSTNWSCIVATFSASHGAKFDNSGLRPHPFSPGLAR